MHSSSLLRMSWFASTYLNQVSNGKVLDVGSYNVNGCYKDIFEKKKFLYQGLDMEEGPNVDLVPKNIYEWDEIRSDTYDAVVSGQALEHIEFYWITIAEIIRVTKEGGYICIIAPNGFREHRYPVDCWRFFTDGMVALAKFYQLELLHAHTNCAPSAEDHEWYSADCSDSMLIARKPYSGKARIVDLKSYTCNPENHESLNQGMISYEKYLEKQRAKELKTEYTQQLNHKEEEINWVHQRMYKVKTLIKRIKSTLKTYIQTNKNSQ